MLVIRPVERHDLDDLMVLAQKAGKGMTSLPPREDVLKQRIEKSTASVNSNTGSVEDYFLLVLEDTSAGRVAGTAAIYTRTHSKQAFYSYRHVPSIQYSHSLDKEVRTGTLQLANDYTDCSEVGSLFVDPDYRGNGHWLARARYLVMGYFRHRFHSHVVAELRGRVDEDGNSPFWDAIGQHFFDMSFDEADALCSSGSNQFITELMPKHPIYTRFLPQSAKDCIGKPHKAGRRALELLQQEGFEYENHVDIFDGGPMMRARIDNLRSVRAIDRGAASATDEPLLTSPCIVGSTHLPGLRIIQAPIEHTADGQVKLSAQAMQFLGVKEGELLCFIGHN